MLVCSVSQLRRRAAIAADVAETATALDAPGTGNVVFATLVDDPASVAEYVDAYLGEIMLEAATAADTWTATQSQVFAADVTEAAAAADVASVASAFTPANLTGLIGWWDTQVAASLNLTGATVNSIADQSGAGQTMIGGKNAFAKPSYSATGFNTSFPGILITTAVGSAMETALGFPMGTGNTLTWFLVGDRAGASSNGAPRHLSYRSTTAANDFGDITAWCWAYASGQTPISFSRNTASFPTSGVAIAAGNHVMIGTVNSSGVVTVYIDGVKTVCQTAPGNWGNGGTLAVGHQALVNGAGNYITATFAEWGVATGYSDDTTAAALYSYLKTKWGL